MTKRLIYFMLPLILIAALLIVLVVASGGERDESKSESQTPAETTQQAAAETPPVASDGPEQQATPAPLSDTPAGPAASEGSGSSVLAWLKPASQGGRMVRLQAGALPQELFAFSTGQAINRVQRCGHAADLPERNALILFIGGARGDLVLHPLGEGEPVSFGQALRLTCAGPDTLQVWPGGEQAAYLRFDEGATSGETRTGTLIITRLASAGEIAALDRVAAFALDGDGLLALRFYPDGEGHMIEADLDRWSPGGIQNLTTLHPLPPADNPDAECALVSGAVARGANAAYLLIGQRCTPGGVRWRLISVALSGGAATEIAAGEPGGGFFPESFTAQLFLSTDGSAALIAVPSGLEPHIVRLLWVGLEGGEPVQVAEFALADRSGVAALEGRHLLRSPDGRWLAVVQVTGDMEQSLWLVDLDAPGSTGQQVIALGRGEEIVDYRWEPGGRLYYIAGGEASRALWVVIPGAEPTRIARGLFDALAVSADGAQIAVSERVADPSDATKKVAEIALFGLDGRRVTIWQGVRGDDAAPLGVE